MTCISLGVPSPRSARESASRATEVIPCREGDPELWFSESPACLDLAKQLCQPCPARQECLAGALSRAEPWGVWGGEIFQDGVIVPRKRSRGRPRKNPEAA